MTALLVFLFFAFFALTLIAAAVGFRVVFAAGFAGLRAVVLRGAGFFAGMIGDPSRESG